MSCLHQIASHNIGEFSFAGSDKVRGASRHEVVGFDSYTDRFFPAVL